MNELSDTLKNIEPDSESNRIALETIALLKMVDEFYSKQERDTLYKAYSELQKADYSIFEKITNLRAIRVPESENSWIKHINQEQWISALDERKISNEKIREFEKNHPLLIRILRTKSKLSSLDN